MTALLLPLALLSLTAGTGYLLLKLLLALWGKGLNQRWRYRSALALALLFLLPLYQLWGLVPTGHAGQVHVTIAAAPLLPAFD